MKVQARSASIGVTMTQTEASRLASLCRDASLLGARLTEADWDIIAQLERAASEVRQAQARKRADRAWAARQEAHRRSFEAYGSVDGFSWTAIRSDYADFSPDPDWRHWRDIPIAEASGVEMPAQCEIRRNVWKVSVTLHRPGELMTIVGIDCTESADRAAITAVVRSLIALRPDLRPAVEVEL